MSVTLEEPSKTIAPPDETAHLRLYFWLVSCLVAVPLLMMVATSWATVRPLAPLVGTFILLTVAADLRPVNVWNTVSLSMSLPVTLAGAMVLSPWLAGAVAFVGACDRRELRGGVSLPRALFNRSQVAASVVSASLVFHGLGGRLDRWPSVLILAFVCLCVDDIVNLALVLVPVGWTWDVPLGGVVGRLFGDDPVCHLTSVASLGMLSLPLALLAWTAGPWGLALGVLPLVLGRRLFEQGNRARDYRVRLETKNDALRRAVQDLARERREERLVIAGELHDEVLPPLFQVHLMGQVLRQDLNRGQLLELDDDLPSLLEATELAQTAIRNLVRDLRQSPLGPGGLFPTVRRLTSELEAAGSTRIALDLEDCECSAVTQLLAYQVVREALTNACRYAGGTQVSVKIWSEADLLRLVVSDDGVGFVPWAVDSTSHFGLQLVAERVEAGGGRVVVESRLGEGTTVAASLPLRADAGW
jgi:signal transduction histidine kinase